MALKPIGSAGIVPPPNTRNLNSGKSVSFLDQLAAAIQGSINPQAGGLSSLMDVSQIGSKHDGGSPIDALIQSIGQSSATGNSDTRSANLAEYEHAQNTPDVPPSILDYLGEMLKSAGSGVGDYQSALDSSAALISKAYDTQLNAVRAASDNAKFSTKKNNKQIDAMYRALGKNYKTLADQEVNHGKAYADKQTAVAQGATDVVTKTANDVMNQQAALAQGLNLGAAANEQQAPEREALVNLVGDIQKQGQHDSSDALQYSSSQERALNRQGGNVVLEGTNRQSDLLAQLQQYLQGNQGKLADIKGQEALAQASNKNSILSTVAGQQKDAEANRLAIIGQIMDAQLNDAKISNLNSKTNSSTTSSPLSKQTQQLTALLSQGSPGLASQFQKLLETNPQLASGIVKQDGQNVPVSKHNVQLLINQILSENKGKFSGPNDPSLIAEAIRILQGS